MKLIIGMILMTAAAMAQMHTPEAQAAPSWTEGSGTSHFIAALAPPSLVFSDKDGRMVLKISPDGKIEVGKDVKADEAARRVLEVLREIAPAMFQKDCKPPAK